MIRLMSIFVMCLALVASAHAATYYVATTGDDANPGTQEEPWSTVQKAANTMVAGDSVIVAAGTYTEAVDITVSGSSGSVITFDGTTGAVMESPDPGASLEAFDVKAGVAYIHIVGFELRGGYDETIFVRAGAHDVLIKDCNIHDNKTGILFGGSFDSVVDGCMIHDNSQNGVSFTSGTHDIVVKETDSYSNDDGLGCSGDADGFSATAGTSDLTFIDVKAYNNGEDGFDLKANNASLDRTESYGNCRGTRFWENGTLTNSLVHGNTNVGITLTNLSGNDNTITLHHNTIDESVRGILANANDPYTVMMQNNIVTGTKPLEAPTCVTLEEDYNLYFRTPTTADHIIIQTGCSTTTTTTRYDGNDIEDGTWESAGGGTNSRAVDPEYLDAGNNDFRLGSASPAIDAGLLIAVPWFDFTGTARPQGAEVDMGAYERTSDVCALDVDGNDTVDVATDVVYISRTLLGLSAVPPSFRIIDPTIPADEIIEAFINDHLLEYNVDKHDVLNVATDVVYISRTLLGLAPVPPSFRDIDPNIPPDDVIEAYVNGAESGCP